MSPVWLAFYFFWFKKKKQVCCLIHSLYVILPTVHCFPNDIWYMLYLHLWRNTAELGSALCFEMFSALFICSLKKNSFAPLKQNISKIRWIKTTKFCRITSLAKHQITFSLGNKLCCFFPTNDCCRKIYVLYSQT